MIIESDKDDSMRERKIVCPKQSYSERQTSSEEVTTVTIRQIGGHPRE
jgi:hypothetical protein